MRDRPPAKPPALRGLTPVEALALLRSRGRLAPLPISTTAKRMAPPARSPARPEQLAP
jgi:hypothetical protein